MLNFTTVTGGTINIINEVGMQYEVLGTLLLNDTRGGILPTIKSEKLLNATEITTEIMRRWLNGKGRQPVTWQTLIECLHFVGLPHIVSIIVQSLLI